MTTEIPESIARPNEDFAWLDSQCNIAEKQLSPEEGLYVLDLKTNENVDNYKISQTFEHLFSNPENNKNCISMLDSCLLWKETQIS